MNFDTTAALIEIVKPYTEDILIDSSMKKDYLRRNYQSDFVTVAKENNFGFEVFENEVIVFLFTDHYHFEDYTSELQEGQDDYVKRAKAFLKELFEVRIRHVECYKGKKLASEKYILMHDDGREEDCIGNTWYGLERFLNPFAKKTMRSTTWQFDKSKGLFTTRQPKKVDTEALEMIDISEDCYIEIFEANGVFTYGIMEMCYDDYYGMYYWMPAVNVVPSGMYDTNEKAIKAAWDAIKCRSNF
ncbi:MAG: hypothetical protein IJ388_02210 [Oscillospiraceae bacterium]|nr:hypothetical protein [Oscillospiraceae bacterium]